MAAKKAAPARKTPARTTPAPKTPAPKNPARKAPAPRAAAPKNPARRAPAPKGGARRGKPGPFLRATPAEALVTFRALQGMYPDAHCELEHRNAFELLCATVLSAQTTDVAVNRATPALFRAYPDAAALAGPEPVDVEPYVSTLGFFRQKAKAIVGLARQLVANHNGDVPRTLAELVKLPGVGRKTANVVLGVAFGTPEGVVVDTHVQRVSQRLGWTRNTEPVSIEEDLCALLPRSDWDAVSHTLIFHGRRTCDARKPACDRCAVNGRCPSAFAAESVGRKPPRAAPR